MKQTKTIIKQSKGITLIALIITIVVLLILAVVAIGAAQESNIVGYAENAASKYEEGKNNEISLLSRYEAELAKYSYNKDSATGGVRAYNFYGKIMIFTPENELYQYTNATDYFPSYKIDLKEVKINNDPNYDITINTNDFTSEEIAKMNLVTATGMEGICAYFDGVNGRDTFYWNPITSGSTAVTITKSIPIQHSDELLAQYYHESKDGQYYFGVGEGNSGIVWMIKDQTEENTEISKLRGYNNGTILIADNALCRIETNGTAFNIKVDNQPYEIREDAKKIYYTSDSYKDKTLIYYIQDNGLIYGDLMVGGNAGIFEDKSIGSNGIMQSVKFFNSSILEIE